MKRIYILTLFILSFLNFANAQNKLMVYTSIDSAWFIPYINGEQYLMAPTDTFVVEIDTIGIELIIHFPDSTVSDIYKRISFEKKNIRHFRIVAKPKLFRRLNRLGLKITKPKEYAHTNSLKDYYMLKDEDLFSFFKRKRQ